MKTDSTLSSGVPESFLARFRSEITGTISGFDRLRFMGTIRTLQSVRGMMGYLGRVGVLLKDFRQYAEALTTRIRDHGHAMAAAAGSSVQFIRSSTLRK